MNRICSSCGVPSDVTECPFCGSATNEVPAALVAADPATSAAVPESGSTPRAETAGQANQSTTNESTSGVTQPETTTHAVEPAQPRPSAHRVKRNVTEVAIPAETSSLDINNIPAEAKAALTTERLPLRVSDPVATASGIVWLAISALPMTIALFSGNMFIFVMLAVCLAISYFAAWARLVRRDNLIYVIWLALSALMLLIYLSQGSTLLVVIATIWIAAFIATVEFRRRAQSASA